MKKDLQIYCSAGDSEVKSDKSNMNNEFNFDDFDSECGTAVQNESQSEQNDEKGLLNVYAAENNEQNNDKQSQQINVELCNLLNTRQKEAVECRDNLLIVAGAGTGKTKTIISKISYYIQKGFVLPNQVIATTFTNKAAEEMRRRLENNIGYDASLVSIGTFHKLCLNIVQENQELLGMSNIQVLPYDDQLSLLRKIMNQMNYKSSKPSQLLDLIQRCKEKRIFDELSSIEHDILDIYQNRLKDMNAVDFADLLAETIKLWKKHDDILNKYREKYKLICVDEYQDINEVQHEWLKLLVSDKNQICCVGDPDQAIYSFRGSDIKYILNFKNEFKNVRQVVLDENYRSSDKIIHNANALIKHNKKRIEKSLIPSINSNRHVDIFIGMHEKEEGVEICKLIVKEKELDPNAKIAILFRTSQQMHAIEENLLNANVKYSIVGSIQLLDRAEVKDAISYLRFIGNPADFMSFSRLIQTPRRGIGQATLDKIAMADGTTVAEKIHNVQNAINALTLKKLSDLMMQFDKWRKMDADLAVVMERVVHESGLFESFEKHKQENLVRWLDSIENFKDADEYSNYLLWSNVKSDEDEGAVQLMTIHASKGLEFDVVFMPGWEEDLFPHVRSKYNIEEERRLAYVALTRAKSYAAISYVQSRMQYGRYMSTTPSRFIQQLDNKNIVYKSFRVKNLVGKKVFHDVFGYGIVEEIGMNHAQVSFNGNTKIVDIKSID